MSVLKIGIIESNQGILERYKNYLNLSDLSECILAVNSMDKFLKFYRFYMDLDIILLDTGLEEISILESIEIIKNKIPNTDIIMFSNIEEDKIVIKTFRLGAAGYLLKGLSKVELERQLMFINQGGIAISPSITKKLANYFSPIEQNFLLQRAHNLKRKEKIVLNLLIEGLTYEEIGDNLDMTINGIRYLVKNIYKKLQVNSRVELYKKYIDHQ